MWRAGPPARDSALGSTRLLSLILAAAFAAARGMPADAGRFTIA
jgi:hypothetical protein